ncbi:MAG: VanZ family protein [Candidatus Omnitrophota bacterium]
MKKNTRRITWWVIIFLYVVFIYATLGIAPGVWDKLNDLSGGRNNLVLYIIYSLVIASLFYYVIFVKKERAALKYLMLVLAAGIFLMILKQTQSKSEKIHLCEYGLLGVMLYNALKIEFNRVDLKLYVCAAFICAAIGAVDEGIQWVLPNRVFDWRDIFMNAVSGALPLAVIRVNVLRRHESQI